MLFDTIGETNATVWNSDEITQSFDSDIVNFTTNVMDTTSVWNMKSETLKIFKIPLSFDALIPIYIFLNFSPLPRSYWWMYNIADDF